MYVSYIYIVLIIPRYTYILLLYVVKGVSVLKFEGFEILDAGVSEDSKKWIDIWLSWPGREIQAHPGYVKLFCDENSKPMCASLNTQDGSVMYPFILRDLKREPYCKNLPHTIYDITTPYGYGGPYKWKAKNPETLALEFWREFNRWAVKTGIVSEFMRFSLFEDELLSYPGTKVHRFDNIVRNLNMNEEELWLDIKKQLRNNIRKAIRNGIKIEEDFTGKKLNHFLEIYYSTMDRRNADSWYYFPKTFFEQINRDLAGYLAYFFATLNGQTISATLVLVSSRAAYLFLGGTYEDYLSICPNSYLDYEIMLWAKNRGLRYVVFGGGHGSNDNIYRYKKSFAPTGIVPFYTGTRIINEKLYYLIIENKKTIYKQEGIEWNPKEGYFPAYRA